MNTQQKPKVSVVLPVYNTEQYLKQAIESILKQTFTNFELIIVSHHDTNKESLDIINSFNDSRIKHIKTPRGTNLPGSLNIGIDEASGEYVVRMDSDDISLRHRLKRQVDYMDKNPTIGISGSKCKTFGSFESVSKPFTDPEDIKANMLFATSLVHPSVIIRKNLLDKFRLRYNPSLSHTEDYDMWVRCVKHFPISNLNEILIHYRVHKKSNFQIFKDESLQISKEIKKTLLQELGLDPSQEEIELHTSFVPKNQEKLMEFIDNKERWLNRILISNKRTNTYNQKSLKKIIYEHWKTVCGINCKNNSNLWKKFRQSKIFESQENSVSMIFDDVKMLIKCLLKR